MEEAVSVVGRETDCTKAQMQEKHGSLKNLKVIVVGSLEVKSLGEGSRRIK